MAKNKDEILIKIIEQWFSAKELMSRADFKFLMETFDLLEKQFSAPVEETTAEGHSQKNSRSDSSVRAWEKRKELYGHSGQKKNKLINRQQLNYYFEKIFDLIKQGETLNSAFRLSGYPIDSTKTTKGHSNYSGKDYTLFIEYLQSKKIYDEYKDIMNKRQYFPQEVYMIRKKPLTPKTFDEKMIKESEKHVLHKSFPIFSSIKEKYMPVLMNMMENLVNVEGLTLKKSVEGEMLEIDNWNVFVAEVMLKSRQIADFLGKPNKFLVRDNVIYYF